MTENNGTSGKQCASLFGERLRLLRTERNLQQSQLGDIFGLSPSAIGSYERSLREPTISQLIAFAKFFNVSMDYITGVSEDRETVEQLNARSTVDYLEFLTNTRITVHGHELTAEEKTRLSDISLGLFWSKISS